MARGLGRGPIGLDHHERQVLRAQRSGNRAADLIGQLSDPRYLKKIPALYYEFVETGVAGKLGYKDPSDLRQQYPKFYWSSVFPYVEDALNYLALTQTGKQVKANLYANVFVVEHEKGDEAPAL